VSVVCLKEEVLRLVEETTTFSSNAWQVCFSQKNISFLAKQVASDTLQYVLASVTQYCMFVDISFHGK